MAKKPKVNPKMFNSTWREKDDAILVDLLRRKIRDIHYDIKECDSPYSRARLRAKRSEYKRMYSKVKRGQYNGNLILSELSAAANFQAANAQKQEKFEMSKYVSSYEDIDFDFETYFSKTRYFGRSLPFISLILVVAFLAMFLVGAFLPTSVTKPIDTALSSITQGILGEKANSKISSLGHFKLDVGALDFNVNNDGNWPVGVWAKGKELEHGTPWTNPETGVIPEKVKLCEDLGMVAIDITVLDVVRATFKLPMFKNNRIDFIEDMSIFKGNSWYYIKFMRDRADDIKIQKGEDGKYDAAVIARNVATYGTILFTLLTILFAIIMIIASICRLFSFTSRRIHFFSIATLISGILAMFLPMFLDIRGFSFTIIGDLFKGYFSGLDTMAKTATYTIGANPIMMFSLILLLIVTILPVIMRNKEKKIVTFVPKGNSPHTPLKKAKPQSAYGGMATYGAQNRIQPSYGRQNQPQQPIQPKDKKRKESNKSYS